MRHTKIQIKRATSSLLALIGRHKSPKRIPVLLYHSIDNSGSVISITPTEFKAHMKYLKNNGYQTLSLIKFVKYISMSEKPQTKSVIITFDDGFKNNISEAFPILRNYGFTATIFLVTNHIGGVFSWDGHASIPQLPLLSWEEIEKMSASGIDFGAHSCNHPFLTRIPRGEQKKEILNSRMIIEERLNKPVTFFCHPYGDTNYQTQQVVRECGYVGAFGGLDYSLANSKNNLYNLKRVGTARFRSIQDFKAGLVGTYEWYIKMKRIIIKMRSLVGKYSSEDPLFHRKQ